MAVRPCPPLSAIQSATCEENQTSLASELRFGSSAHQAVWVLPAIEAGTEESSAGPHHLPPEATGRPKCQKVKNPKPIVMVRKLRYSVIEKYELNDSFSFQNSDNCMAKEFTRLLAKSTYS